MMNELALNKPEAEKPEAERPVVRAVEQAPIQKIIDKFDNDPTPRLIVKDGKIDADHPDSIKGHLLLMDAVGTGDIDFLMGLLGQLAALTGGPGRPMNESELNFLFSVVKDAKPKNQIHAMLAAQMAATHSLMMRAARDLEQATSIQLRESAERILSKLSRTFLAQAQLVLQTQKTEQAVTVQN